nr:MAG TPA_asm: hypothetical protein [Caudoviricetes sp.]
MDGYRGFFQPILRNRQKVNSHGSLQRQSYRRTRLD